MTTARRPTLPAEEFLAELDTLLHPPTHDEVVTQAHAHGCPACDSTPVVHWQSGRWHWYAQHRPDCVFHPAHIAPTVGHLAGPPRSRPVGLCPRGGPCQEPTTPEGGQRPLFRHVPSPCRRLIASAIVPRRHQTQYVEPEVDRYDANDFD
jgi:hypothetical protein